MGKKNADARAEDLGRRTRDAVLDCRVRLNPHHDRPGWEELRDYGRETWARVAEALVLAGWAPPGESGKAVRARAEAALRSLGWRPPAEDHTAENGGLI